MKSEAEIRSETCEARLPDHLKGRLEQFAELEKRSSGSSGDEQDREAAIDELYEIPLSVEKVTVWKVLLSTGGPADWFEYEVDADGDLGAIRYHFQDWYDHAERRLDGAEYDQAEQFGRAVTADFYTEA